MTESWDWKKNISQVALNKTANPNTGTVPPSIVRGALYRGPTGDPKVYMYGGTTSTLNTSSQYYEGPTSNQYTLWSYDPTSSEWGQYDVSSGGSQRPNHGAWTDAPDQGLGFFFNGQVDNGSSVDVSFSMTRRDVNLLSSMQVIDLKTRTAKNVSTAAVSNGNARIGGSLQYLQGIGAKGMLALIGGAEQSIQNTSKPENVTTLFNGTTLVSSAPTLVMVQCSFLCERPRWTPSMYLILPR